MLRATDVRRPHHPKPLTSVERWWELEAQGLIRGLKPPVPPDQELLLAFEDEQLVGAIHFKVLPAAMTTQVRVAVVALGWQRRGIGSALLSEVVDHPATTGHTLRAAAHRDNVASRSLMRRHGFAEIPPRRGEWIVETYRLP